MGASRHFPVRFHHGTTATRPTNRRRDQCPVRLSKCFDVFHAELRAHSHYSHVRTPSWGPGVPKPQGAIPGSEGEWAGSRPALGCSPVPCACIRVWRPSAAFVQRHKSSISVSLTTSGQRACGTREKPERRCGRRIRDTRAPAGRGSKRQAHDARYRALGQALCHRILPLLLHFSFFAMLRLDIVRLLYSISPGEHVQLVKIIDQRQ